MTVLRVLSILLALVATVALALGSPICCVLGDSCCAIAAEEQVEAPCCSNCGSDEPEDTPEPAPRCQCGDHAPDLSVEHAAVALVAPMIAPDCALVPVQPPVRTIAPVERAHAPPAVPAALTLPLLL